MGVCGCCRLREEAGKQKNPKCYKHLAFIGYVVMRWGLLANPNAPTGTNVAIYDIFHNIRFEAHLGE